MGGYAFEPQNDLCEKWSVRKTECFNIALGSEEKEVRMARLKGDAEEGTLSGVASVLDDSEIEDCFSIRQRRLGDFLKEKEIKKIDFVSIDVEGYEMEVLKGIDFEYVDIYCFVIENNKGRKGFDLKIRNFMQEKGYEFIGRLYIDDVFIKRT